MCVVEPGKENYVAAIGGRALVPPPGLGQLASATAVFHKNVHDPKASIVRLRGLFQALPHQDVTPQFINSTITEVMSAASLTSRNNTFIGLTVEPFLPNILKL
ncbi:hypothetical protein CVT24_006678 [Panaeolus cyanescens]|uniref:Uncharacterized protein n=1 Tax=Panaeolus cyanescens TaxID=181874 RepID=A0A409YRW2_9AGAR|nr:hypothetical protein CVT24_006678 [Panaeolus cyanescens]